MAGDALLRLVFSRIHRSTFSYGVIAAYLSILQIVSTCGVSSRTSLSWRPLDSTRVPFSVLSANLGVLGRPFPRESPH